MFFHLSFLIFLIPVILADTRYTDAEARQKLTNAGIPVVSSGNCTNQNNATCTSLQGVHSEVIDGPYGIIAFKRNSGCTIIITGGTEVGHTSGTYSHYNGWKLDVRINSCMTSYIENGFTQVTPDHWSQPTSGYIYYYEVDHWDCCFNAACVT